MLAEYRELCDDVRFDWGAEFLEGDDLLPGEGRQFWDYGRYADVGRVMGAVMQLRAAGLDSSWDDALWSVVGDDPPRGLVAVEVTSDGPSVRFRRRYVIPGGRETLGVLVHNATSSELTAILNGVAVAVRAGQARLVHLDFTYDAPVLAIDIADAAVVENVLEPCSVATLVLTSDAPSRWSVSDERGDGWYPANTLRKWDSHDRPFFHGRDAVVAVPAVPLVVRVSRGVEYRSATMEVAPAPGTEVTVDLRPERLYDAAASGWYGGDLHVHLNYSGDYVAAPDDAAAMQIGEGLHLMNLVAGNLFTARIYDKEALEQWVGEDLDWSEERFVARWGVEYRNDMLGHFHALGMRAAPSTFNSGHARSARPDDWPPNAQACREFRELGATVGYTHPVLFPMEGDRFDTVFAMPRTAEAREAVADAALGLVDSIDLGGVADFDGTRTLFYRLLNSGLRLTATAGTDVFLSFAHFGRMSNPPGWARAYAQLGGQALSVAAWQDAVRAGRTFVTNGPWIELEVTGAGPGAVLDCAAGDRLAISARCKGQGMAVLSIIGPDGPVAETAVDGDGATLDLDFPVEGPCWIAAVARGPLHPDVLGTETYAHTSPVYIEIEGRRIARAADANWCLGWIDRLEATARTYGQFSRAEQLQDLLDVLDEARLYYRPIAGLES